MILDLSPEQVMVLPIDDRGLGRAIPIDPRFPGYYVRQRAIGDQDVQRRRDRLVADLERRAEMDRDRHCFCLFAGHDQQDPACCRCEVGYLAAQRDSRFWSDGAIYRVGRREFTA